MGEVRDQAPLTTGVDGQVLAGGSRLAAYANFVKVAHTVFALPFAVVGIATASRVHPVGWRTAALAGVAFAAARFAGMGFNRIADRHYDALNPRTAGRELPSGRMSLGEAWALVVIAGGVFVGVSALLNPLCFGLSPLALAWILGYSYAKRFTSLSHLWLGLSLAIAPVGGYLAVAGSWSTPWWTLLLVASGVAAWVAGFDILYALQDQVFDREHRLRSAAVALGAQGAIVVSRMLHAGAVVALLVFGAFAGLGAVYTGAVAVAAGLLAWEHRLVKPGDYSRLDAAFFTMNGIISGVIMAGAVADVAWGAGGR